MPTPPTLPGSRVIPRCCGEWGVASFASSCESPYISLEDSLHVSPRLLPQPTMSGSPQRQSLFTPSATGLQGGQFTSRHFDNWDQRVQHLLESIIQKHDEGVADNKRHLPDLRCDFIQGLQTLRQDYQQGFAKLTQEHKSRFDQLKQDSNWMQAQIQNVDTQVKALQAALNKVASKEELAVVEHNQFVSLDVSDNNDTYHTPVGMGEFPRPVLHSIMRKVSQKPPTSVSTYFTPISFLLDLSIGVGNHVHSGTPAATVDMGVGAFGSILNGVYRPFVPTGAVPAGEVTMSMSVASVFRILSLNQVGLRCHPVRLIRRLWIPPSRECIKLDKLKICLEGKTKQVYPSFDESI